VGPREFWTLTLHELGLVMKGHQIRMEHYQQLAAWHVAHVINLVAKQGHSVTPAKLLGKVKPITDPEKFAREATQRWLASEEVE
jgi:ascorbate-specific PTS system EIIC-type component UlaA